MEDVEEGEKWSEKKGELLLLMEGTTRKNGESASGEAISATPRF